MPTGLKTPLEILVPRTDRFKKMITEKEMQQLIDFSTSSTGTLDLLFTNTSTEKLFLQEG